MVVADFAVRDGRLADVRISGDFFLYPEHALEAIDAALIGAQADTPVGELSARIAAALPAGTEMLGFTCDGVAEAVRRGLAP